MSSPGDSIPTTSSGSAATEADERAPTTGGAERSTSASGVEIAPHTDWTSREATVNGIRLHYVEAGAPDDPLVFLLHGFPELWYAWHRQIPSLVDAGFRVAVPDLRGYNRSEAPEGVVNYRLEELVADVTGLIDHLGRERAHVAGHDWGGSLAWELAARAPDRVDRLAICNAPHPEAYRESLGSPGQLLRSWYVFFFQIPRLPEWSLRRGDCEGLRQLFRDGPSVDGAFDDEDIERYAATFSEPGSLTGPVNYYRALFRGTLRSGLNRLPGVDDDPGGAHVAEEIDHETLVLWGMEDEMLSPRLVDGLDEWVSDVRIDRLEGVGHWTPMEAPERVNESLVEFLRDADG